MILRGIAGGTLAAPVSARAGAGLAAGEAAGGGAISAVATTALVDSTLDSAPQPAAVSSQAANPNLHEKPVTTGPLGPRVVPGRIVPSSQGRAHRGSRARTRGTCTAPVPP